MSAEQPTPTAIPAVAVARRKNPWGGAGIFFAIVSLIPAGVLLIGALTSSEAMVTLGSAFLLLGAVASVLGLLFGLVGIIRFFFTRTGLALAIIALLLSAVVPILLVTSLATQTVPQG